MQNHRSAILVVTLAAVAASLSFPASRAEAHDLAITAFTATPNPVYQGKITTFNVTITNYWIDFDSDFDVGLWVGGKEIRHKNSLESLDSGQSVTLQFPVRIPKGYPPGEYEVTAKVTNDDEEDDFTNNERTIILTVLLRL